MLAEIATSRALPRRIGVDGCQDFPGRGQSL